MSATGRKDVRRASDFYETPLALARAALQLVEPSCDQPRILDPGAGKGVWGRAARERWPNAHITGLELPGRKCAPGYDAWVEADYLTKIEFGKPFDLMIGNPPYSFAEEFIVRSFEQLQLSGSLLFLLRLNFLEGQKRYKSLWKKYQPALVAALPKRPSFTGGGTDACAYAIFVWDKRGVARDVFRGGWLDWSD